MDTNLNTDAPRPWEDGAAEMAAGLLATITELPRTRLDRLLIDLPMNVCGAYLQFLASRVPEVVDVVSPLVAEGRVPAYVGSATTSLRSRLGRYRQSLDGVTVIGEQEVFVSIVPCATAATALFVENTLLTALDPVVLNRLGGWGQMTPGGTRRQRISPVDAVWPGKRWAPTSSAKDEAMARLRVLSDLTRLDPAGLRWPPLLGGAT